MKHFFFRTFMCFVTVCLVVSCDKDLDEMSVSIADDEPVAWLLNEGSWNGSNSELSLVSLMSGTIQNDCFYKANHRRLGDVGQDAIVYGGKMYVTLFASNTVEVVDVHSGKSVTQISMGDRQPRYMAVAGGKVYVSCYSSPSVVAIDTLSLQISATCLLDAYCPEQICVLRDSLYVCSSWQYAANGSFVYDNKLCVVDLKTFTHVGSIVVGANVNVVKVLNNNTLAVNYRGDYTPESKPGVSLVDVSASPAVVTSCNVEATQMDCYNGDVYCMNVGSGDAGMQFWRIDGNTLQKSQMLQSSYSLFNNPYYFCVNQNNGDVYITDAQYFAANGDLYCFSSEGVLRWHCEASTAPTKLVPVP